MTDICVIGAGPAGLMAAEVAARAGRRVVVADQMPSFGRKFLMAGKSGLNLTKDEAIADFLRRFDADPIRDIVSDFGPDQVQEWARGLGQDIFTGSSGMVFPKVMKASPLLRAWLARLDGLGVQFRRRWRWIGFDGTSPVFETPDGQVTQNAAAVILAMGGASWPGLGSDGKWAGALPDTVKRRPFLPSNTGILVDWSPHMDRHFGQPVKPVRLMAGDRSSRAEIVITRTGIEGPGIYPLIPALRGGARLRIDLKPDWDAARLAAARKSAPAKESLSNQLRKRAKLGAVQIALLRECASGDGWASIKSMPLAHNGPQGIDRAISTAGGVDFDALDDGLMLRALPGVFCAGEMINWDAPTGGYLITGCLATGRLAGRAAAKFVTNN